MKICCRTAYFIIVDHLAWLLHSRYNTLQLLHVGKIHVLPKELVHELTQLIYATLKVVYIIMLKHA